MKYKIIDTYGTQLSGSPANSKKEFTPWQPSSWPEAPEEFKSSFHEVIEKIFRVTIIDEIDNVISDAKKVNGSLEHRGHVIAIAQLCAIDVLSSYAFFNELAVKCQVCGISDSKINKYKKFIADFFPDEYKQYTEELYKLYRNTMIHSWNLFDVGIRPDNSRIEMKNGTICFGLDNFQNALKYSLDKFLERLSVEIQLQKNTIGRYKKLKKSARD